jgi:hypothetical protein
VSLGWPLIQCDCVLIRRDQDTDTQRDRRKKTAIHKAKREISEEIRPPNPFTSDFWTVRIYTSVA